MPATLLQKTRGTQSATNTPAPASNLQPITSDEQNCIKQTTFGQSAVFPEESIPFIDLQNHADNATLNTNKTGFKNYFNQETLNNFFGWNSGTSTFKTYAGGAGKILAGFLDPAWLSTLFTKSSSINSEQYIKYAKRWYNFATPGLLTITGNTFNPGVTPLAIAMPLYTVGDKFNFSFEFCVTTIIQHTAQPNGYIKIQPWIRKQNGVSGTPTSKIFLTSFPNYTAFAGTNNNFDFNEIPFSKNGNTYRYYKCFQDVTFPIDTSVDTTITNLDFGFDVDAVNSGAPYTQFTIALSDFNCFDPGRLISLEIFRA